jgi:hypothetical protein
MFGKMWDDPVPMPIGAERPGDENNGVTLPHFDIVDIIPLNHHELIHTVLGFRINLVLVIFYQIAAATNQEYAKGH